MQIQKFCDWLCIKGKVNLFETESFKGDEQFTCVRVCSVDDLRSFPAKGHLS